MEKITKSICGKCKGKRYSMFVAGNRAAAKVCDCASQCPHCNGAGYVYATREETFSRRVGQRTYEALAPCVCRLLQQRIERFSRTKGLRRKDGKRDREEQWKQGHRR